ncbi:MAG: AAA family ATPase [Kiritimatiellae bacterium]|nr:AAA family ATPase [Kiritimatiellia bacterium]
MFTSFSINDFRCFRSLTLDPLERVNLLTGTNNVGKTAVLEALFLHIGCHNPSLPFTLNAKRGLLQFAPDAAAVWGWLFRDKNMDATIELASKDEQGGKHSLRIRFEEPQNAKVVPPEQMGDTGYVATTPDSYELRLEYENAGGKSRTSRAFIEGKEIKMDRPQAEDPFPGTGIFVSAGGVAPNHKENAERFSNLARKREQEEITRILRIIEPRLKELSVLAQAGESMVYGDTGIGELVPTPMMGAGVGRLLTMALAIANAPNGFLLVDEVENGFHYSVLGKIWNALARLARRSNTQVFATTHSWECIKAAHRSFAGDDVYDFRLHRLDRKGDEIRAISYDQDSLGAAVEQEIEVR